MKKLILLSLMLISVSFAQSDIAVGTGLTVNFSGFTGEGFAPSPAAGQLDSDFWSTTGFDNNLAYGGTASGSNDMSRGSTFSATGGIYGLTVSTNAFLAIRPGGSDFTPGTITLRVKNTGAEAITSIEGFSYDIMVFNDQARGNSFNFSYSTNGTDFTEVPTLDYNSTSTADVSPVWTAINKSTNITGINVPQDGYIYFRWTGGDVDGTGSRDGFGLDNIIIPAPTPVELTSFTSTSTGNAITLNWATATEVDNYGFEVERSADNTTFTKVGFVAGAGNSNVQKQYSFVDENLANGTYYYRLKQVDTDGSFEYSQVVSSSVSETPATFSLDQNYPNPFNPSTKISFALAKDSDVKLSVFNTLGEEVAVLINSTLTAGNHSVDFNATNLTSGMYLYKIQAGEFVSVKKMTLAK